MTPDTPNSPREELEARLTALLLGELPDDEAAALRQTIAEDAELVRLHDRLQQAIALVRETFAAPETETAAITDAPKLAAERREKLLASFKAVRPKELAKRRAVNWHEWAALAAMIVGLLAVAATFQLESEREALVSQSAHENSLHWFFSGAEKSPQRTTSIPGRGAAPIDAASPTAQGPRRLPVVRAGEADAPAGLAFSASLFGSSSGPHSYTVAPSPPPLPVQSPAPEAEVRRTLERSPRQFAGIALPGLGDALQQDSEGVSNGREKDRAAGPSQIAQSDFFRSDFDTGGGGFAGGERRAGAMGGGAVGGIAGRDGSRFVVASDEPAFGRNTDKQPASRPAETTLNAWSINAGDSGLFAKDISGPVSATHSAPATPAPDTAGKSYDARFSDLNRNGSLSVVTKGGVAGAAIDTIALGRPGTVTTRSLNSIVTDSSPGAAVLAVSPPAPLPSPLAAPATPPLPALVAAPKPDSLEDNIQLKNAEVVSVLVTNASVGFGISANNLVTAPQDEWAGVVSQDGRAFGGIKAQQDPRSSFSSRLNQGLGRAAKEPQSAANTPAAIGDSSAFGVISQEAVGYVNVDLSKENILAGKPNTASDGANRGFRRHIVDSPITDAKDAAVESKKLAEIYRTESAGATLNFYATADQSGSESKRELGRALGERPKPAQQPAEEAKLFKRRVDIALPKGERSEVSEAFQVATGPVAIKELNYNDPASGIGVQEQAAGAKDDYATVNRENNFEKLPARMPRTPASQSSSATDSKNGVAERFVNLAVEKAKLDRELDQLRAVQDQVKLSIRQDGVDPVQLKSEIAGKVALADEQAVRRQALKEDLATKEKEIARVQEELERRKKELNLEQPVASPPKLAAGAAVPQPEVSTTDNAFSTFSLNVSDVSFKLAAASLEKGQMPDPATVRSEEFINAFDYRDPDPKGSAPIAFAWERARYPFAHDRDLVRFSVKTAASGRQPGRPLNLVLLLDNSGSMERADRVRIIQECLLVLAGQLQAQDRVSVVAFARTPRLWVDGLPGNQAGELPQRVGDLTPQGGTNLEDAMNLAYQTALRHYLAHGVNRVVLLTDGAANLGDVQPESLKKKVEAHRKQGIALDCFGIGWEGFNDELLETLSRNGDGRYGFVNTPEAATSEFAGQLAGALKVAASDVKVQVEFNPRRATAYRQIGYAKHQLKKEQFRDNTVDAAEIGAAEAGNALYVVQVNPAGEGPIGIARVRFKVPGTSDYREHEWPVPYEGAARTLEQSSAALRLAASASAFSEWLVSSPYAGEVTPDKLLGYLGGVPETWPVDPRPKKLEWMIRQAKSVAGK